MKVFKFFSTQNVIYGFTTVHLYYYCEIWKAKLQFFYIYFHFMSLILAENSKPLIIILPKVWRFIIFCYFFYIMGSNMIQLSYSVFFIDVSFDQKIIMTITMWKILYWCLMLLCVQDVKKCFEKMTLTLVITSHS